MVTPVPLLRPLVDGKYDIIWQTGQRSAAGLGIGLALLAFGNGGTVGGSIRIHQWGVWMAAPSSFWSAFATFCTYRLALDLQRLVALSSFVASALLAWRQLAIVDDTHHAALGVIMLLQSLLCVRAAWVSHSRPCGHNGSFSLPIGVQSLSSRPDLERRKSRSLPRGWRCREDCTGKLFFEHKRTGQRQWDLPDVQLSALPIEACRQQQEGSGSSADDSSPGSFEGDEAIPKSPRRSHTGVSRARASSQRQRPDLRSIFESRDEF